MKITHKIAAALVVMFVTLMTGAAFILDSVVRGGFGQLEQRVHERNQARVGANFTAFASDLRERVVDYAYWDDTYAFLHGGPSEPYTTDLTDDWMAEYGLDALVFIDHAGRIRWTRYVRDDGVVVTDDDLAQQLSALFAQRAEGRAARSGMIWLPRYGFMMVSFARATMSDGSGEPTGLVIMAERLTSATLAEQTQMRIDLISAADPGPMTERMQQLQTSPQVWQNADTIFALMPVRDPFGEVMGAALMRQPREAMALGNQATSLALFLLAGILVVALGATWLLLRAMVVKPLQHLEEHFHAQEDQLRELPDSGRVTDDEVGKLAHAYNALIVRLQDAGKREQSALVQREAEATANRLKSDFLANVSHELRRPLDAIVGYTELISEELPGPAAEHTRADLGRVRDAARRLLGMISEILDISRIDAGTLELRPETFPVGSLVRSFGDAGVQVETTGELGVAYTDRRRLHQSLSAAIGSLRQSAPTASVTLRATRDGRELRFEVHAEGAQLTSQQLETANALNSGFVGHGLGLLVAQKLLAALGGRFHASNQPNGASFKLTAAAVLDDHALAGREAAEAA